MNGRCETCKYAKGFAYVEKPAEPEPLPKRTGLALKLFGPREEGWEQRFARSIALRPYLQYKNRITCQRFPTFIEKFKTDTCGEYEYKP